MALRRRIRRKTKRRAPAVRRNCGQAAQIQQKAEPRDGGIMIGGAHDPAEKAADQMAAKALGKTPVASIGAVSSPSGAVHRKCAECEVEEGKDVKRKSAVPTVAPGASAAPAGKSASHAINALGSGRPMSKSERGFFEPRFGRDFSQVRIHEGAAADKASKGINAEAFTHGNDVAFANGAKSKDVMAHELAHVAQGDSKTHRLVRRRTHTDCSTKDSKALKAAEARAIVMLDNAIKKLKAKTVTAATKKAFINHFGAYSDWRRDVVVMHYKDRLKNLKNSKSFDFQCEAKNGEQCEPGVLGFTYWTIGDVHICRDFFKKGLDVQASTIVHELQHLFPGQLDLGYHQSGKKNESWWIIAVNNADSYSGLLEDLN